MVLVGILLCSILFLLGAHLIGRGINIIDPSLSMTSAFYIVVVPDTCRREDTAHWKEKCCGQQNALQKMFF